MVCFFLVFLFFFLDLDYKVDYKVHCERQAWIWELTTLITDLVSYLLFRTLKGALLLVSLTWWLTYSRSFTRSDFSWGTLKLVSTCVLHVPHLPHQCLLCLLHVKDKLALMYVSLSLLYQAVSLKLSGFVWLGLNLSPLVSHSCTCWTASVGYHWSLLLLTALLFWKLPQLSRYYFFTL